MLFSRIFKALGAISLTPIVCFRRLILLFDILLNAAFVMALVALHTFHCILIELNYQKRFVHFSIHLKQREAARALVLFLKKTTEGSSNSHAILNERRVCHRIIEATGSKIIMFREPLKSKASHFFRDVCHSLDHLATQAFSSNCWVYEEIWPSEILELVNYRRKPFPRK